MMRSNEATYSKLKNWATNITFEAKSHHAPQRIEQLQALVQQSSKVKVIGSGHCFNNIADTKGTLISLERLEGDVQIDPVNQTVTLPAGMNYVALAPILHEAGYALRNMASLPQVTVIGACMTATHGSGDGNGNLATHVVGLEIVKADGELVQLSRERDGERFNGMVVALGALGIVTKVTLAVIPAYSMRQQIYRGLPLAEMVSNFDAIMGSGYSVSLFTPWRDKVVDQVWVKQILPDGETSSSLPPSLFGAKSAKERRNPLDGTDANACTEQLGIPGPWYERLPHFHTHSKLTGGDELQTEYFVARQDAVAALLAVESINKELSPVLKVSEVRSMTSDNLWLSMAYGRDTIGIHISWYHDLEEVMKRLPMLEEVLAPFDARPHWGKLHSMPPERVQAQYEKIDEFRTLLAEFDPQRKFGNAYLDNYIWGT